MPALFVLTLPIFQAVEALIGHFNDNPQAEAYFAIIDVEGNAKVFATPHKSYLSAQNSCPDSSGGRTSG
jgi:hypothetical protein